MMVCIFPKAVTLIRPWGLEWLYQEEPCSNAMEVFLGSFLSCLEKENAQRQPSPPQLQEESDGYQGNELHVSILVERSLSDLRSEWGVPVVVPLASALVSLSS